jgi:hypothetical protein
MGNKYNAVRTVIDGFKFDSIAESKRYQSLKLLKLAGEITDLEIHPKYDLHVADYETGEPVLIGRYIGDFSYFTREGEFILEDVKSPITRKHPLYRWKKKHVEAEYGIEIAEVSK